MLHEFNTVARGGRWPWTHGVSPEAKMSGRAHLPAHGVCGERRTMHEEGEKQPSSEAPAVLPVLPTFFRSFRLKLVIFVMLVAAVVATAVGAAGFVVARNNLETEIEQRLEDATLSRARLLAAHIQHL